MSIEKARLELALAREADLLQIRACCAAGQFSTTLTLPVKGDGRHTPITTGRKRTTTYQRHRQAPAADR